MASHDTDYIEQIKNIIAARVKPGDTSLWKQRDFETLIDLIYKETRVKLSLSTLKRIWQEGYSGTPHPSTLDALAQYAGYENWYSFRVSCAEADKEHTPGIEQSHHASDDKPFITGKAIAAAATVLTVVLVLILTGKRDPVFFLSPEEVAFDTVPAEIIFKIETRGRIKDSLFLIPSQRPLIKIPLKRNQREIRYRYPMPGYYTATLNYGGRTVDSSQILAKTKGWTASVYNYNRVRGSSIKSYFTGIDNNGILSLPADMLASKGIAVDGNLFTIFYYVTEPFRIDYDSFILETGIKADSIFNYPYPYFYISLLTLDGLEYVPFISPGIEADHSISFSDSFLEGNTNSLSPLITDVYRWNDIRIENVNKQVNVTVNGRDAVSFGYMKPLNPVCGFSFTFLGTGTIEYIRLSDRNGRIIYEYL